MPSEVILFESKDGIKKYPLSSSSVKLDFANEVDLSEVTEDFTVPADGIVITDTGEATVNKGNIIRNSSSSFCHFIPYRHTTSLPKETTADDIKYADEESSANSPVENANFISVKDAIDNTVSDIKSIQSSVSTLSGKMTTAEGNISTLQSGLSTTNTNVSTLSSKMTAAENAIATLQSGLSTTNTNVNKKFAINKFTFPASAWKSSSASADFPYEASVSTTKYSDTFEPTHVEIVPANDTPFFTAAEQEAMLYINANLSITSTSITIYAKQAITCNIKIKICGES